MLAVVRSHWLASLMALSPLAAFAEDITPQGARDIARDAHVCGFPVVDLYRITHACFIVQTMSAP